MEEKKPTENLVVIRTLQELEQLKLLLSDKDYIATDTETSGVEKSSEIIGFSVCWEPDTAYYVVTAEWNVEKNCLEYLETKGGAKSFFESLKGKNLIAHNAVFDCFMIENNYGVSLIDDIHTDTMVLAHLLDENRSAGLKELGVSLFGDDAKKEQEEMKASVTKNGGMLTKAKYELYKADSELIARYGAKDTILTLKLFYVLVPQLIEQGLDKFFYDDESMPLLRGPTYDLNTTGLKVDSAKLQKLRNTLEASCIEYLAFINKEVQPLVQEEYPGTSKAKTFNIGSGQQLAWLLYDKLENVFPALTKEGRALCRALDIKVPYSNAAKRDFINTIKDMKDQVYTTFDARKRVESKPKKIGHYWKYLSTGKVVLPEFAAKYEWLAQFLKYKKELKLLNTYVTGIQEKVQYGIIRPSFLQIGTTSGRYSCIAEGQTVSMPGGDRPIEEVKVGDYVYCYTEDGRPTVSKVTNVFDNGVQDCIKLTWKSQGTHKNGELICTPDHRLKTRDRGWVEAKDLSYNDRIYHLRRARNLTNGRMRVYGADYFMMNEEQLLKIELLGGSNRDHAHHLNGDKTDNNLNNIEVLSSKEHLSSHSKELWASGRMKWEHLLLPKNKPIHKLGVESPVYISMNKIQVLRALAKARGRTTSIDMDFNTFKRKAQVVGVNLKAVKNRYNSHGQYLSKGHLLKTIKQSASVKEAIKTLGINYYKFHELVTYFGLTPNHKIQSTVNVGPKKVYDLEVEGHHNFIVNELCVHNCKNPNFQNLPRDDKRIKECMVARPGKVFVGADYEQLEPRVFASFSQDARLMASFKTGDDFYSVIGAEVFNKTDCTFKKDDNDANFFGNKYKSLRKIAKEVALAATYGTTAFKMAPTINKSEQEAQEVIDDYFNKFPGVHGYMLDCHETAKSTGVVHNLFGRPRRIPQAKEIAKLYGDTPHGDLDYTWRNYLNLAVNHPIQSTGASIMNRAAIACHKMCRDRASDDPRWFDVKQVLQCHDELVLEGPEALRDAMKQILRKAMERTVVLPGVDLIAKPVVATDLGGLK